MIPQHAPVGKSPGGSNPRPRPDNPDHSWTVRIPAEILAVPLSDQAFRIWLALDLHAGSKPYCWVGDEAIARETGKRPRTISRIVAELEEAGYIERAYANGVTRPGKGEKARRIGIILRKRVHPATPAADDAEAIDRARAALLDRAGLTSQSCVVPLRRVAKSDFAELRTEGIPSESPHKEQHPCTGPGMTTTPEEAPEPETIPIKVPPEPKRYTTIEEMVDDLPGRPDLAPAVATALAELFDDHQYRGAYVNRAKSVADGDVSVEVLRAALKTGRASVASKDLKPGMQFTVTFDSGAVLAPTPAPAPAPTPNLPPAAESEERRQGVWDRERSRFMDLTDEERQAIKAEAAEAHPGVELDWSHLIPAMWDRENRLARVRAEAARPRRRPMNRAARMPAVAMA